MTHFERVYCRGCSKEFVPSDETQSDYIEYGRGGAYYHPKCDVDILSQTS